jgi:putative ABC transport system ATP-binding protein
VSYLGVLNVHKRFGIEGSSYDALRCLNFTVEAGEFVAVRGPSGCGKSTLLHIVGAMDRPTSGQVWLNGQRLDQLSYEALARVRRRCVGFVFQSFNLLPTLTALENVELPLMLDGIREKEVADRARAALDDVGLGDKMQQLPSQLSGGEMQRVAIARAIAIDPDLLIADEPTGSLDSSNGQKVLDLLAELNRTRGLTILMATHAEEAAAYATRTLSLRDGCLVEGGLPTPGPDRADTVQAETSVATIASPDVTCGKSPLDALP